MRLSSTPLNRSKTRAPIVFSGQRGFWCGRVKTEAASSLLEQKRNCLQLGENRKRNEAVLLCFQSNKNVYNNFHSGLLCVSSSIIKIIAVTVETIIEMT